MFTPRPHPGTHLHTAARQAAARLRRLAAALAAVSCALLASAVIIPAASASIPIPPGGPAVPAPAVRVVTAGGMAGWQITLIAVGAPWPPPSQPSCWTGRGPPARRPRAPP